MKPTRPKYLSVFQIVVVLVAGLMLSAVSSVYSGLLGHSSAFAQIVDQVDEDDRLVLADFQQRNAGSVVTPGGSCPSAKLTNPERRLESDLGQGNLALEATFDLPDTAARCWVAILFQLNSLDISQYAELVFDIKADVNEESLQTVRIEWKAERDDASHPYDMAVYEVHDIGQDWQAVRIPISEFVAFMEESLLEDWNDVDQLLFVIESKSSSGGTILLDNIMVEAQTASKSPVPPKVMAHFEPEYRMGTTDNDENSVAMTIVADTVSSSMVAMLEYTTPSDKAEFTIELDGADTSEFDALTFFARAGSEGVDGLNSGFEVSAYNTDLLASGAPDAEAALTSKVALKGTEWRKYELPLQDFVGEASHEEFWASLDHLSFVFSSDLSGESGAVYLDNVQFERLSGGSPDRSVTTGPTSGVATTPPEDPTLTATAVPVQESPTSTVVPTATETPTPITGEPSVQLHVSDFDACRARDSGAAYESPTVVSDTYPEVDGRGCVLKAQFDTNTWGAYWFRLGPADLSGFSKLQFDMAFEKEQPSALLKVELKRSADELSIFYLDSPPQTWQTVTIPFADLYAAPYGRELSSFSSVAELVFVVESSGGTLYLDNIRFIP